MTDGSRALRRYAEIVDEWHERLTALDRHAGDGDFGDNLQGGLALVLTRLDGGDDQGVDGFQVASDVFLDHVGGTSGPLFGLLFSGLGRNADVAGGLREGLAAIQRVGEAEVGDRTLVDALAPAVAAVSDGGSVGAAARSAIEGAAATANQHPRMGRASYVGERALGQPDAGAVGVALLLFVLAGENGEDDGLSLDGLR
jgi:dihydroxyacetone kinase